MAQIRGRVGALLDVAVLPTFALSTPISGVPLLSNVNKYQFRSAWDFHHTTEYLSGARRGGGWVLRVVADCHDRTWAFPSRKSSPNKARSADGLDCGLRRLDRSVELVGSAYAYRVPPCSSRDTSSTLGE